MRGHLVLRAQLVFSPQTEGLFVAGNPIFLNVISAGAETKDSSCNVIACSCAPNLRRHQLLVVVVRSCVFALWLKMKLLADQPQLSAVFIKINIVDRTIVRTLGQRRVAHTIRWAHALLPCNFQSKLLADKIIAVFAQLQKVIKSRQWHRRRRAESNEALTFVFLLKKVPLHCFSLCAKLVFYMNRFSKMWAHFTTLINGCNLIFCQQKVCTITD